MLQSEEILVAEFEYIAQTAFQAHEDRARVSTFYVITIGSILATLLSSETAVSDEPGMRWAFTGLFFVLSLFGLLTLLQLVRLRQAWFESVRVMNQIKHFFAQNVDKLDLKPAFLWHNGSRPSLFKPKSVSFLLALQVCLLGGLTFGAAVFFAGLAWGWSAVAGVAFAAGQLLLYGYSLRMKRDA